MSSELLQLEPLLLRENPLDHACRFFHLWSELSSSSRRESSRAARNMEPTEINPSSDSTTSRRICSYMRGFRYDDEGRKKHIILGEEMFIVDQLLSDSLSLELLQSCTRRGDQSLPWSHNSTSRPM